MVVATWVKVIGIGESSEEKGEEEDSGRFCGDTRYVIIGTTRHTLHGLTVASISALNIDKVNQH